MPEPDLEMDEEPESPLANLMELANSFEQAGVGLSREESYRIFLALKQLVDTNPIRTCRFWGEDHILLLGVPQGFLCVTPKYRDRYYLESIIVPDVCLFSIFFLLTTESNNQIAFPLPNDLLRPSRITRNQHSLSFTQMSTGPNYYMYSFFPRTIRDWNALPETVVQAFNVDSFKMSVLQHFSN